MLIRLSFALALTSFLAAPALSADIDHGRRLVEANCGKCHAVGFEDDSAHESAPPLRSLWQRFPVETIDEMLLANVRPEHPDMPTFKVTPTQAADIAAYVASLQPLAHGKLLVEENCASCHSVASTGDSPHGDAPPFRTLSKLYPIDALEEAFVEGIETGHPDMPSFTATPTQIADILAYISSIQAE